MGYQDNPQTKQTDQENKTSQTQNIQDKTTKKTNFKDLAIRYTQTECKKLRSSDKTIGYYKKTGEILNSFFKSKNINEIIYKDCKDFQEHLNKTLQKKTVNNYTSYSKRLFDYAIKTGLTSQNPFKLLTSFKITKDERSLKDNFTMEELAIILNTSRDDLRNYMLFALHTGLRLNKIWQLGSGCAMIKDGIKFIKVRTAKQKGGEVKFRELPIHKNIEKLWDLKWLEQIKEGKDNSDYFSKRLNKYIHKQLPKANVSFHRLRGNFTKCIKDYCFENGFSDITPISLGHASDLSTNVYAKEISLKAKLKAMEELNEFIEFIFL